MAATTVTEFKARSCTRCGGAGFLSAYQHRKGGECFRCGGAGFLSAYQHRKGGECFRCGATGNDPQMVETVRDMTDDEVLAALAAVGLPVMAVDTARPETGDYLLDLFLNDDEVAQRAAAMAGARAALAAL